MIVILYYVCMCMWVFFFFAFFRAKKAVSYLGKGIKYQISNVKKIMVF